MEAKQQHPLAVWYGNQGLKEDNDDVALKNAVKEFCGGSITGGGTFYGGGTYLGGVESIEKYGNSVYSQGKERMIRAIAADVFKALKVKADKFTKTEPISKVVEELSKRIPNPRHAKMFNSSFSKSPSQQKETVKVLRDAINSHYGSNMIPDDLDENEAVNRIAEVMYSLFQGLHTEFMTVAGDALRVLKNMQALSEIIDSSYRRQKDIIASSGDERIKAQSQETAALYDKVKEELKRQTAIMGNLIDVAVGPTGKSLVGLLEDNRDFAGLVRDIKEAVGTERFSDKLGYLLAGVSSVARSAELIDKALKKLGMSMADFKAAKSANELRLKIYKNIVGKSPSSKELEAMMAAAEVIYKNDYSHNDIVAHLSKTGGSGCGCGGGPDDEPQEPEPEQKGAYEEEDNDEKMGGFVFGGDVFADELEDTGLTTYWAKKSLGNKIAKNDKNRKFLLNEFRKMLRGHMQIIVDSANVIGPHVGKAIPVNEDLDKFIDTLKNLESLDRENMHVALSGWAKDAESKDKRDRFMSSYVTCIDAMGPLMSGPHGEVFKNLASAMKGMIATIDEFSEKIVKAVTDIHVDTPQEIRRSLAATASAFFGAADGGGGDPLLGDGSWSSIDKAKASITYFYSIAHIKTNLANVAEEMAAFGDGYEQVLGEEAGWLINKIKKEHNDICDILTGEKAAPAGATPGTSIHAARVMNAKINVVIPVADRKKVQENITSLWNLQTKAKIRMVEIAQAVDLYLRAFADGIARDPESISSVVKMLDQVEIVAKWFNDRSGDNLAALFECFPGMIDQGTGEAKSHNLVLNEDGKINNLPVANGPTGTPHYYAWVESKLKNPGDGDFKDDVAPGNPFIQIDMTNVAGKNVSAEALKSVKTQTEKTIKSMRALENILSVFATVGSKFGEINPQAKTFMTPGQIFNGLCDYITASSLTTGFGTGTTNVAGAAFGSMAYKGPNTTLFNTYDVTGELGNMRRDGQSSHKYSGSAKHGDREIGIVVGGTQAIAQLGLAMSAIPVYADDRNAPHKYHTASEKIEPRTDSAGYLDRFYDTDMLFMMTIKSIVAKVFTAVDTYRLFNRPTVDSYQSDSLNPLRTILGGAEEEKKDDSTSGGGMHVPVVEDALELYLRLPLLAEWYRAMYGIKMNRVQNDESWVLSILPTIDGTWSKFIAIMFDKYEYVDSGNYTENQIQEIITEINQIHGALKSKYPKSTTRNIIIAFTLEMNRVMGFLQQKNIDKYIQSRRANLRGDQPVGSEDLSDFVDYDILDSSGQFGRSSAPSDKFTTIADRASARKRRNLTHLQGSIIRLREKMDYDMRKFTNSYTDNTSVHFVKMLRNYKQDLETAKDPKEKYNVALKLIQGNAKISNTSTDKLVMVHESIAAPLSALYNCWKVMSKFNAFLHGCSVDNLQYWNSERKRDLATAPDLTGTTIAVEDDYKRALSKKYREAGDVRNNNIIETFIRAFLGEKFVRMARAAFPVNIMTGYFTYMANAGSEIVNSNIDYDQIFRDILCALMDLSCHTNGLVQVEFGSNNALNVDTSKLEDLCTKLLQNVRSNINKLRLSFSDSSSSTILDKYEDVQFVGSLRWLEENMCEVLFRNRDKTGLPSGLNLLQNTFRSCLQPNYLTSNIENTLREIIYYRYLPESRLPRGFTPNVPNSTTYIPTSTFPKCLLNNMGERGTQFPVKVRLTGNNPSPARGLGPVSLASGLGPAELTPGDVDNGFLYIDQNSSWDMENIATNSLLFSLNRMIHNYIKDNVETMSIKFYLPLIESFMNSAAAHEISQNKGFPNIVTCRLDGAGNPIPIDGAISILNESKSPLPNSVLFESTCEIIKAIVSGMDGTMKRKRFLYDSMAEIPESMREIMKANLPYYSKMFEQVYLRAMFLKKLLSNTSVSSNLKSPVGNELDVKLQSVPPNPDPITSPLFIAVNNKSSEDRRAYFDTMLSHMIDLASSIKKCCDNVYKELADSSPFFMELNKDFIQDYKKRYGGIPFMPASNVLLPQRSMNGDILTWNTTSVNLLLLPTNAIGSEAFEYNYGSRLLLARNDVEPTMEHMPGAQMIYNKYAATSGSGGITTQEYSETIKNLVLISRFLNDGAVYSKMFAHWVTNFSSTLGEIYVFIERRRGALNGKMTRYVLNSMFINIADELTSVVREFSGSDFYVYEKTDLLTERNRLLSLEGKPSVVPPVIVGRTEFTRSSPNRVLAISRLRPCTFQSLPGINVVGSVLGLAKGENTLQNRMYVQKIVDVTSNAKYHDRASLRTWNILDMNIVPINVHAFMKEVPFINILNYSYTFDRMAHEFILPSYTKSLPIPGRAYIDGLMIRHNTRISEPRDVLVQLLTHPYADLNTTMSLEPSSPLISLITGNDDLKLGRPKYISDQLWGKALLHSQVGHDDLVPKKLLGPPGYNVKPVLAAVESGLKYLASDGLVDRHHKRMPGDMEWSKASRSNPLSEQNVIYCEELGFLRLNTKLVRNLLWMTQLQRVMRAVLVSHLSWLDTPVVRGLVISKPQITEYESNQGYRKDEFDGTEYDPLG